jgi:hypothetical protein
MGANIGIFNVLLWLHTLVEVWTRNLPHEQVMESPPNLPATSQAASLRMPTAVTPYAERRSQHSLAAQKKYA